MNMENKRLDEVSKYYISAVRFEQICGWLFWIIGINSLFMLYANNFGSVGQYLLQISFIVCVILYFAFSQVQRFYLVPWAERMRRRQMLSDAFGAPLSHDKTSLYYNNEYSPSIQRLGSNTMENALFSKEIASKMLVTKRLITGCYGLFWVIAFSLRHNNLEILSWITQIVFSGEVVAQWLNLEVLRLRHERTYERLHDHFLNEVGGDSPKAIANILDNFVAYESAKSSAGILLSSKKFHELNPELTEKWDQIRYELDMHK